MKIPNSSTNPVKPFAIAIDHKGNAWVTGNGNATLAVVGPKGDAVDVIGAEGPNGQTQIANPMGAAADSKGNVWVSNSDWVDGPCTPGNVNLGPGTNPSVALFLADPNRKPYRNSPFKGGGITIPWGIAIDGNDTVWVANFGFPFGNSGEPVRWTSPNRVSHFCGADAAKCPPSKQEIGAAISPDGTGYTSDALDRNTGIAIDPSGNVWLANNWKELPIQSNPGGNSIAVMVGAAAPVKTPLIGPVGSFAR